MQCEFSGWTIQAGLVLLPALLVPLLLFLPAHDVCNLVTAMKLKTIMISSAGRPLVTLMLLIYLINRIKKPFKEYFGIK